MCSCLCVYICVHNYDMMVVLADRICQQNLSTELCIPQGLHASWAYFTVHADITVVAGTEYELVNVNEHRCRECSAP